MESAREAVEGFTRSQNRHTLILHFAKASQVIKSKNVVDMRMRVEDGIHAANILPEALGAKIGCGIDDE